MQRVQLTRRQSEYLAFISQYEALMEVPPSEGDIAAFFGVAGSSAHQMVVTLEKKGALTRTVGGARSLRPLVDAAELPELGWAGSRLSAQAKGSASFLLEFSDFVVHRVCSMNAMVFAKVGAVSRVVERLVPRLRQHGLSDSAAAAAREHFMELAWSSGGGSTNLGSSQQPAAARPGDTSRDGAKPASAKTRLENPRQGSLFEDSDADSEVNCS